MFITNKNFIFDIAKLEKLANDHIQNYNKAIPFQHVIIDGFLPRRHANKTLKNFPNRSSKIWLDWRKRDVVHQPKKQGIGHASNLLNVSPYLLNMLSAFNSYPFLNFLEKLTGIEKILPDPYFHGGGLHQILNGGKLDIHADFNELKELNLYRRINVLLYLNKNWKKDYNGELELWDESMSQCIQSIEPIFNRLIIFNTNKKSYHGHPKPLNTPEHITRKSLAFYYYTVKHNPDEVYNGKTDWQDV